MFFVVFVLLQSLISYGFESMIFESYRSWFRFFNFPRNGGDFYGNKNISMEIADRGPVKYTEDQQV